MNLNPLFLDVGGIEKRKRLFKALRRLSWDAVTMAYNQSFLKFYAVYPRKMGKFKGNEYWIKQKLAPKVDLIIAKVKLLMTHQWKGKEPKYIPYVSTFIKQHGWEDDLEPQFVAPIINHSTHDERPMPREPRIETPEIKKMRDRIKEETRRIAKGKLWTVTKERALIINLNYELDQALNGARKVGEILKK